MLTQADQPQKKARRPTKASSQRLQELLLPILAVLTGLIIGAIVIVITDAQVVSAYGSFFRAPGAALTLTWKTIATAYGALFNSAFGNPKAIYNALQAYLSTGDSTGLLRAFWPLSESLVASTPYIFGGLAVALGFRCGLFNIGAEGQIGIGALTAAYVGYKFTGLSPFVHLPLAILAGASGGAIWAAIPGYLKAKTGAHEVVNTIMMNWISFRLSDWLLTGPMKAPGYRPVTPNIEPSAALPRLFPLPIRFNAGFFLALGMAALVYWFLFKTTLGFEIRTVGANPRAARYAGMSITRNIMIAMVLSGALAGLAGAAQVLGVDYWVGQGFSAGYGFDSIALALLGKSHPGGVVLASLLFGALRSGATGMQSYAGIPVDIISIIQGFVIMFVAAPVIIRWLYRLREKRPEEALLERAPASSSPD